MDRLQRYMSDRIPLDEVAEAVKNMLDRGMTIEEIIAQDCGEQLPPPSEKPSLSTISAVDLRRQDIPPLKWTVEELLPTGTAVWASPPKFGKSWAALDLCLSVTTGGQFLGYRCNKSGALYLCLEDSLRRVRSRMEKLLAGADPPDGLEFATDAPLLAHDLIETLEAYMEQNPEIGLVVIDTLAKVRSMGGGSNIYMKDYTDIGLIKRFADSHNISVLIIHHLRKMSDTSDPFARISGTNGISGAVDTMVTLTKESRNDDTATLSITGRDVEQNEIMLKFDKDSCKWMNLGDKDIFSEQQAHESYQNDTTVKTIRAILQRHPEGWEGSAKDLLGAGLVVTNTALAGSSRSLSNKLKTLGGTLLEHDNIMYKYKPNGTGGGRHRFTYANEPQFEELNEQMEINPFSEG